MESTMDSPVEAKVTIPVDQQDKLWTQIDVLDDVRQMASQRNEDNLERKQKWEELRKKQVKLVELMKQREEINEQKDVFNDMKQVFEDVQQELKDVSQLMRR